MGRIPARERKAWLALMAEQVERDMLEGLAFFYLGSKHLQHVSTGLSASRIIGLARYHTTYASAWIGAIARSPGDQMNVAVHDGLSGISADIDPYVVSVGLEAFVQ
jgi:hypothetical protein